MTSVKYYNGQEYQTRAPMSQTEGFLLATAVSSAILSPLAYLHKPFLNQLRKEEPNNYIYKDALKKAADVSGLYDVGVRVVPAQMLSEFNDYKLGNNACFIPKTSIPTW